MAGKAASVDPDRSAWDVIVLGGAAAGENVAQYATQFSDLDAVLVEAGLLGGECSYWACMPSKALLRPAEQLSSGQHVPGVSSLLAGRELDVPAVLARRDTVVNGLDDTSQVQWALGAGIDVLRGYGRLAGERTVEVSLAAGGTRTLTARHAVVVDTGSCTTVPQVAGLAEARAWTSRDVTNMHEVPRRVIIYGGGVVACEAATWLRALGVAELTVVHRRDGLLPRCEPFAGRMVADRLREAGVRLLPNRSFAAVTRQDPRDTGVGLPHGGEVTVELDDGATLTADELVLATGRTPNTQDIGLTSVGCPDGGFLEVDDQQAVRGVDGQWLYAIGDVCGRALRTHMGKYQARIAGEVIAARAAGRPPTDEAGRPLSVAAGHRGGPQVTFTQPEVGSAGMTEREARAAGVDVETAQYDMAALAGTFVMQEDYVGRAELVVDRATDTVVGATFVGSGIADLVHSATTAIVGRLPLSVLWHVVPSYPTASEVWLRLLETIRAQRAAQPRQ
ncbi:dihydrolipoamide dehydrogenase [Streptomyces sp. DvalAA-14]|uniref:dihydrolipoyl dehydrogenase family protein n=1 Tax=unclassified Streptomyces TaxID=2593676 RepID=UPI00081B08A5|nr:MULTISPECIES: NAD(P)/FAD-dependent oxidoreductase [unclassified Streptomyces]MYS20691.1 FAD-dependent oxidoreductase [Streptomyces sp. SID4948]SCD74841.1 dihydrolipoamide dehydrogenase [Streptomyces sp. DvalAA-14]